MGKTRPDGYWRCDENIYDKIREIIERLGYFPSAKELDKLGEHNLSHAISQYHGGFIKVRQRMGYKLVKKPNHYWRDWNNLEPELKEVIQKNGGRIPTYKQFLELGRSDLAHAIQRHHGGINGIRKKLEIHQVTKRKNDTYKDLNNVLQEIEKIISENNELNGELPSAWWLQQNGYHNIYQAIRMHHGGFRKFRTIIGKKQASLENGTWEKLDFVLAEMKRVMETYGFENPPGQWTLKKLGYTSICYSIQKYHGGFINFREKLMEYLGRPTENKQLESILEQYAGGSND